MAKRVIKRVNERTTLEQAFSEFLIEKEAKSLSAKTILNYRETYNMFLRYCNYSEVDAVEEVRNTDIYSWIKQLKDEGKKAASINHYLREIRAFLYWCMDNNYLERFKVQLVEAQEEQPKLFTDKQLELLLEKPKKNDSFVNWRTWAVVNWVLATGNRAATICEVQIGDINFNYKEISLRHTKNKKAQNIPLSPYLETILKEYIRMWRYGAKDDKYLFCSIADEQMTTNCLKHSFRKYCLDRDVERTNIHGLRHNFSRGWIKNNGNMFSLQKVLGHSSLEMTKHYVKLFNDDLKEDWHEH